MTTSPVELQTLTSACLGPEDCIDFYDNPYTALGKLQDAKKDNGIGSSVTTEKPPDSDFDDVDWQGYEPPTALRKTINITSPILLDLVFSSIENVKRRVAEERRLKKEAAEKAARRAAQEKDKAKGKEPYLPIVIPPSEEPPAASSKASVTGLAQGFTLSGGQGTTTNSEKVEKRRRFALRNLFQRSPEGGESSAAGRARETLRSKIETQTQSIDTNSADPKMLEAIAALRKTKLFKSADPNALV